eukprot:3280031-Rhodomonas_salina.4
MSGPRLPYCTPGRHGMLAASAVEEQQQEEQQQQQEKAGGGGGGAAAAGGRGRGGGGGDHKREDKLSPKRLAEHSLCQYRHRRSRIAYVSTGHRVAAS